MCSAEPCTVSCTTINLQADKQLRVYARLGEGHQCEARLDVAQHGQNEGEGLAGTRLRDADAVAARHDHRQRLSLQQSRQLDLSGSCRRTFRVDVKYLNLPQNHAPTDQGPLRQTARSNCRGG